MTSESQVHIANIDHELKALWEQNKEQKHIRACLFNLIVYTQEERRKEYFQQIVSSIIQKFPCRILFIQRDIKSDKDYLYVTVTNETYVDGGTTIACDQITLQVGGIYIDRVAHIISPHIVPDLPIYLFWGEDPTHESEILPHLQDFASRLIFDTECTQDLQKFSQIMLQKLNTLDIEIMDIHWALISPWRDVIGQIFHNQQRIQQLRNAKEITIQYNKLESEHIRHSETQSLYIQAWLAHQLGWKIKSVGRKDGDITLFYETENGHLKVSLTTGLNNNLQCGAILGVKVNCGEELHISLVRQEAVRKVVVHVTTGDQCLLPYTLPLPNLKRGFNFIKEIFYESTSEHYQNMLQQLSITDWNQVYR